MDGYKKGTLVIPSFWARKLSNSSNSSFSVARRQSFNSPSLPSRNTSEYKTGDTKLWDIGGDEFGTLQDVGELEIAQLSLDEPELESVVFEDDDGMSEEMDKGEPDYYMIDDD